MCLGSESAQRRRRRPLRRHSKWCGRVIAACVPLETAPTALLGMAPPVEFQSEMVQDLVSCEQMTWEALIRRQELRRVGTSGSRCGVPCL